MNRSPRTIQNYGEAVAQLSSYLATKGRPIDPRLVDSTMIEDFVGSLVVGKSSSTAANRFRGLQQFFKWLEGEGEIDRSPCAGLRAPVVPVQPPRVLTDDEVALLLSGTSRRDFRSVRDHAIIRALLDTGSRRAEIANLRDPNDERLGARARS